MGIHGGLPPVTPPFGMPNAGDSSQKSPAECIREGVATIDNFLANHPHDVPNSGFDNDHMPIDVSAAEFLISVSIQSPGVTPELAAAGQKYLDAFALLLTQGDTWHTEKTYSYYTGPRDELTALLNQIQPPS